MKLAIIGSRDLRVENLGDYLPEGVTEIVSGGARGVDASAREYALAHNIRLKEFLPEYDRYPGRVAPIHRNDRIIDYADRVLAFWNGVSRGTMYGIERCKRIGKPVTVIRMDA